MSVYLLPSTSPLMNMPLGDVFKVNYYSYTELSQERERERKIEIGTFNNFAKTRGSGENPKQRQQNSYGRPFHWYLKYFLDFTDRGITK